MTERTVGTNGIELHLVWRHGFLWARSVAVSATPRAENRVRRVRPPGWRAPPGGAGPAPADAPVAPARAHGHDR